MRHRMSQTACHELISSLGPRYSEACWDDKRRILDEFTAATGYHRKYAIAVLNHPPEERSNPIRRPRGQRYDAEVQPDFDSSADIGQCSEEDESRTIKRLG